MDRRQYIGTLALGAVGVLAGCTDDGNGIGGPSPVESGTARGPDETIHRLDVEEGETVRIEVDNEEGFATDVILDDPDGNEAIYETVETEATLTHEAEQTGVYTFVIFPDERASYQIYIED